MTVHYPNTVIVDLGTAIKDYRRELKCLDSLVDTDPNSMLSWLSSCITTADHAEDEVDNAIMESISANIDIPSDEIGTYFDAALGLGFTMVKELRDKQIFPPRSSSNGEFPYEFVCLLGSSAVFTRPDPASD
ncbi:hypothetical protein HDG34_003204 [Paraburkholderia sp. HC6.4b]|uniref:hypothetical protein n=1 Tax=unclassified Paraburkholderia TaxID=2615204 RepID=UPI00160A14EC|nr:MULTISPECIES: hypothetical protein [unclassified Paraburkholderia]MBB5409263.1 hypothetical protein [Paraburkholderia sp. HC6.4b]MBB5450991.1 hypothetical protein [Paraburkholderia sp. Kb1A]